MPSPDPYASIEGLAAYLQGPGDYQAVWAEFERALGSTFGHRFFTVLAFDAANGLLRRVYSSRPDVDPVGGAKAVTDSFWTQHVLRAGKMFVGSNRRDIEHVFSDHRALAAIGCDSVLNIPVRSGGVTIGTMNLLDAAGHYDRASRSTALVYAALAAAPLMRCLSSRAFGPSDDSQLEHV